MGRQRGDRRRWWRLLLITALAALALTPSRVASRHVVIQSSRPVSRPSPPLPSRSVEEMFGGPGPWVVTSATASAPGTPGVTLVYPADLGANGYRHPIIAFGNGTFHGCDRYDRILRHYASWGFAVVCPNIGWSGSGEEIWAAAQWLREQDRVPGSVFYGKLDPARIGTSGGSQGASGALNAAILAQGAVDSTVTLALVDPAFHVWGPPPDLTRLPAATLLLSGTSDPLVDPAQQRAYYDQIPGAAAMAARVGCTHEAIGQPGWGLAYATAWFKYMLQGDPLARRTFLPDGEHPATISAAPGWTSWTAKNLPGASLSARLA